MQDEGRKKKCSSLLNGSKSHNLTLLDVTWRQIWRKKKNCIESTSFLLVRNVPYFISSDLDISIQSQINLLHDVALNKEGSFEKTNKNKKNPTHNLRKPEEFVQQTGAQDELLMTSPRRT